MSQTDEDYERARYFARRARVKVLLRATLETRRTKLLEYDDEELTQFAHACVRDLWALAESSSQPQFAGVAADLEAWRCEMRRRGIQLSLPL